MLSEDSKAKVWLLWPFAVFFLITALLVGGFFYFIPSDSVEPGVSESGPVQTAAQIEELTNFQFFRRAFVTANGGEEKLRALSSVQTTGTFESGGQSVPFRTIKRRPDKSITTLKMEDYNLSFVVNAGVVWQRVDQPRLEPQDTLKTGGEADAIREMGHFFGPLMHVVLNEPESILGIEETTWEGEPALSIAFKSESRGMEATAIINPQSMTPVQRLERFADGTTRKVLYADYRQIGGTLLEPFVVETFIDDALQNRVTVEKCEINVGAASFLFEYTGEADDS